MSLDTLDKDEIIQFSKLADDWWNEEGSMSFLHSMSKIRTKYIKESITNNFKIEKKIKHEKLKRNDHKYDFLIPIKYNFTKPITGQGSCIFIHLTKDYKPTAGCIALVEKDFLIMLKLIKKNSKIKIF